MSLDIAILVLQVVTLGVFLWGFNHKRVVVVREPKDPAAIPEIEGSKYAVLLGDQCLYEGSILKAAKIIRGENPGSALIADGVNRG